MVHINIFCDHCRKIITEDRSRLLVESGPLRANRESIDICGDCAGIVAGWCNNPSDVDLREATRAAQAFALEAGR